MLKQMAHACNHSVRPNYTLPFVHGVNQRLFLCTVHEWTTGIRWGIYLQTPSLRKARQPAEYIFLAALQPDGISTDRVECLLK